jgi:hypothetical protein
LDLVIEEINNEGTFTLDHIDVPTEVDTTYSVNQSLYPSPTRYFRELQENRTDVKVHFEQPIETTWAEDFKFSAGASFVRTTRQHQEDQFGFEATNANLLNEVDGDLDAYFSADNFVVNPNGGRQRILDHRVAHRLGEHRRRVHERMGRIRHVGRPQERAPLWQRRPPRRVCRHEHPQPENRHGRQPHALSKSTACRAA